MNACEKMMPTIINDLTKFYIKKNKRNKRNVCVDQFRSTCMLGAYYFKNDNQGKELCTPIWF